MTSPTSGSAGARGWFRSPRTLTELLAAVADAEDEAVLIAGGQSLLPSLARGAAPAMCLIDVTQVAELRAVAIGPDHVELGAATSFSEFLASPASPELPAIAQALRCVGNITIRNRATFGGSLAWADPRAQLSVALLIHDATVRTTRRELAIEDFIQGPFQTALQPGEVITSIRVRVHRMDHPRRAFAQLLDRNSVGKAIVSVALSRRSANGKESVQLAVGGLADRPVKSRALPLAELSTAESRAETAERWLDSVGTAAPLLADPFHSVGYRRQMAGVLLRRLDPTVQR